MKIEEMLATILQKINFMDSRLENIESKIDSMDARLQNVEKRMDSIEERMDSMEKRMDSIEKRMDSIEERMSSMEKRMDSVDARVTLLETLPQQVREIQMTLDNEVDKKIRIIAEGHSDLSRKLDEALQFQKEKELILLRVSSLEGDVQRIKGRIGMTA